MDKHSAHVQAKALELLRQFAELKAVGLAGSQASGDADEYSDLDLQAFTAGGHPDPQRRKGVYGSMQGMEVGPLNHCVSAVFELPPLSNLFAVDWLRIDGMRRDVLWISQEGMDRAFSAIREQLDYPEAAAGLASSVQSVSDPEGFLKALVSRYPEYTEQRARRKAGSAFGYSHFFICTRGVLAKAARRNDVAGYNEAEAHMVATLIHALCAVNRSWQRYPRRLRYYAKGFEVIPANFADRLESLLMRRGAARDLEGASRELRSLFQDLARAAMERYPDWKLPLDWPQWSPSQQRWY